MKKLVYLKLALFLVINFIPFQMYGQLSVNLGNDTTYCIGLYFDDNMELSPNSEIINAVEPITYSWECQVKVTDNLIFTASDFLNDTTILLPNFIDVLTWPDWIEFKLTVVDGSGSKAKDSIKVRFSLFTYSLTDCFRYDVKYGDSIQFLWFPLVDGGIEPLKYYWSPSVWLEDSTDVHTWCKPESDILYSLVAVDSCGCVSVPVETYCIHVLPDNVTQFSLKKPLSLRGSTLELLEPVTAKDKISMYSMDGRQIYTGYLKESIIELNEYSNQPGMHIVILELENEQYKLLFFNEGKQ